MMHRYLNSLCGVHGGLGYGIGCLGPDVAKQTFLL